MDYDKVVAALDEVRSCSYSQNPKKLNLDLKNRESPSTNPLIEEPPNLEYHNPSLSPRYDKENGEPDRAPNKPLSISTHIFGYESINKQ